MSGIHVRLRVGNEAYALPVEHVLEVAELGRLAPVPGSPPEILGVRNLRGQILPVIDLARVLGIEREGTPARMLVAEQGGRRAGFAVDEVSDVGSLAEPAEETDSEFLVGAALDGDELVGVVDVARLFDVLERTR
jgi:purine-binding chemotaxis protein CheW